MKEASGAQTELSQKTGKDPLLELPFDQYQRYRDVQVVVERLREGTRPLRLLDVGGGEAGYLPAPDFFPQDLVVVADLHPLSLPHYVRTDGTRLPFKDNAFHAAFSCDTLEHIAAEHREQFLRELFRVSSQFVVLVAPFRSRLTELAERSVQEIFTAECGKQNQALLEHVENGLPELAAISELFRNMSSESWSFSSGNLRNWLVMNSISFVLGSLSVELYRAANRIYNRSFYWSDHCVPAYRTCLVGAKKGTSLASVKGYVQESLTGWQHVSKLDDNSDSPMAVFADLPGWLDMLRSLKAVVKEKDIHIGNLNQVLETKDAHIGNLNQALETKDAELEHAREEVRSLKSHLAQRERLAQELEVWSNQVKDSNGWRTLQRYYRLREGVLPEGSRRRSLAMLCWRVLTRQPISRSRSRWTDL